MTPLDEVLLHINTLPEGPQAALIVVGIIAVLFALWEMIKRARAGQQALAMPVLNTDKFADPRTGGAIARVLFNVAALFAVSIPIDEIWGSALHYLLGTTIDPLVVNLPLAIIAYLFFKQISRLPELLIGDGGIYTPEHVKTGPIISIIKAVIFLVGAATVLHTLGLDVSVAVAVGGIVTAGLALASQATAANLVCFGAILVDQPFEIGDRVSVLYGANDGRAEGTVESIGLLSTRLDTDEGRMAIPNKIFSNAIVIKAVAEAEQAKQDGIRR